MKPLPPPDHHFFDAAVGWLMLGNPREAEAEFCRIDPERQRDPDLLEFKWGIHAAARDWQKAAATARLLQEMDPHRAFGWIHLAYSLRRVHDGGLAKAWDILRPAHDLFPKEALISYNLACYAAQLGQLDQAWDWLGKACATWGSDKTRTMALEDPDLAPLRERVKRELK
jgi:tetratricopeptide (TPR) repeat protein